MDTFAGFGAPPHLSLAYHAIDPYWRDPTLSVEPSVFAAQMRGLAARGYRGRTFSDAVLAHHPGRSVSITFDDAYPSVLAHALPVLRDLGWPATVFAPTATVTSGRLMTWLSADFASEKRQLTWSELSSLAAEGWEVGSHSRTHPLLSTVGDAELEEEIEGSRAEIVEKLGSCTSIGYPWGEVNDRIVGAARRAGYAAGSGLAGRFVHDDALRVPRIAISGVDGSFRMALKTSGLLWTLRSSRLWDVLDRVRGLDGRRDETQNMKARVRSLLHLG
ncbi:MAG: polysaccharide deacetylase family protein [Actinobacteria bacterium]|nr:polysaccharide deacetylase family protein [Actinomycetota bacterium]